MRWSGEAATERQCGDAHGHTQRERTERGEPQHAQQDVEAERADRVAVLESGRLVEVASHTELVEQGERYARLWRSWQAGVAVA